jgi:hypothetical protein
VRIGYLERARDKTGISGVGVVAELVEFTDGTVALRWLGRERTDGIRPTTVLHDDIASVLALHGHERSSRVRFLDGTIVAPTKGIPA